MEQDNRPTAVAGPGPDTAPGPPPSPISPPPPRKSFRKPIIAAAAIIALIIAGFIGWELRKPDSTNPVSSARNQTAQTSRQTTPAANLPGLQLDANKNYGNKYADGILPVGDGKYTRGLEAAMSTFVRITLIIYRPARAGR